MCFAFYFTSHFKRCCSLVAHWKCYLKQWLTSRILTPLSFRFFFKEKRDYVRMRLRKLGVCPFIVVTFWLARKVLVSTWDWPRGNVTCTLVLILNKIKMYSIPYNKVLTSTFCVVWSAVFSNSVIVWKRQIFTNFYEDLIFSLFYFLNII